MGYFYVLVPIREQVLMNLDAAAAPGLLYQAHPFAAGRNPRADLRPDAPAVWADRPSSSLSLGKMGAALHHLLTGEFGLVASPLSRAILGGTAIGPDLGYGPARYLWADEVHEIAGALATLAPAGLRERYDPAALKAGHPATPVYYDEDDDQVFDELDACCRQLVAFYRTAAARGDAVLLGVI